MHGYDAEHDRFWSTVHRTLENLRKNAPEGCSARVQVVLGGEAFEPAGVGKLGSWPYFEQDEEDASAVTEARRVVFVQPEYINRVEVKYVREAKDIGFRVEDPRLAVVPSEPG